MKIEPLRILAFAAAFSVCSSPLPADSAEAEHTAYVMAKRYADKGFFIAPTDNHGVANTGEAVCFYVPVNKGLDYVFLVGTDSAANDTDLYVYDDLGGLILDDRRVGRLAGVQFRSSYNGTAAVYVVMANASEPASWRALVGRRGTPASPLPDPPPHHDQAPSDTPPSEHSAVGP